MITTTDAFSSYVTTLTGLTSRARICISPKGSCASFSNTSKAVITPCTRRSRISSSLSTIKSAAQPILVFAFLVLLLSAPASAQVLFSIADGWTEEDDPYASTDDLLTVNFGSALDSRYVFEASDYVDTYCVEISEGTSRSHTYSLSGDIAMGVGNYEHYTTSWAGDEWTIQSTVGTNDRCRFNLWKNKGCSEWHSNYLFYPSGCEPDFPDEELDEGTTDTYTVGLDDLEVTCITAGIHRYVKCQGATEADLDACVQSSLDEDGGGDGFRLADACPAASTSSSSDTEYLCDVKGANSWEISVLGSDQLSLQRQEVLLAGIPNATFRLVAYTTCGTSAFDRTVVESFDLLQFTAKERVCGPDSYSVRGRVEGWFPWYGYTDYVNESWEYGVNSCASGLLCVDELPYSNDGGPDVGACYLEPGASCYDGRLNLDETEPDYGGVCGQCIQGSRSTDDYYWAATVEQFPKGYFGVSLPFNSTVHCPAGEDATHGAGVIVLLVSSLLLFVLAAAVIFAAALAGFTGASIFRVAKTLKGSNKKEEGNIKR